MKLLIVDDEPIIRRGIKALINFNDIGITECIEAIDGLDAFEKFEKYLPEIILVDINMPKMNGLEFSSRVRDIKPETKIAILTGYDYFDYAQKAIKIGVDDYILKPVSKEDISQLLHKLVKSFKNSKSISEVKEYVDKIKIEYNLNDPSGYKSIILEIINMEINNHEFSLAILGNRLGLSIGYLSSLFPKLFKINFKEYILNKRLDKAKILLLSTDMKNYEISDAIGFSDSNYFSTAFKKMYGVSPNKYRDKVRD